MSRLCMALAALALSGCAGYSGFVNSFAPEKPRGAVTAGRGDAAAYATGDGFCLVEAPPAPVSEIYMVMPEAGGKQGTVVVTFNDGREQVLHGDYHAMTLAGQEAQAFLADRAQLEQWFGPAAASLPPAPYATTLYFLLGKDALTPESEQMADQVLANIVGRASPEVRIVGHTDTVGSASSNEVLSSKRAQNIRARLIALGVPAESIQAYGMGERELPVPTRDNTKEPRNRCVEISVR